MKRGEVAEVVNFAFVAEIAGVVHVFFVLIDTNVHHRSDSVLHHAHISNQHVEQGAAIFGNGCIIGHVFGFITTVGNAVQGRQNGHEVQPPDHHFFRIAFVPTRFDQNQRSTPLLNVIAKGAGFKFIVIAGNLTRNKRLQHPIETRNQLHRPLPNVIQASVFVVGRSQKRQYRLFASFGYSITRVLVVQVKPNKRFQGLLQVFQNH